MSKKADWQPSFHAATIDPALAGGLVSTPVVIQNVTPNVDGGRFPVKREVGDVIEVGADIFRDGHDKLAAVVLHRRKDEAEWRETPMTCVNPGLDRWVGAVELEDNTTYVYTVEAWADTYESWCAEVEKKIGADQDVSLELIEGRALLASVAARAKGDDGKALKAALQAFDKAKAAARADVLLDAGLRAAVGRWPDRGPAVRFATEFEVVVDRVRARFAAWYEMFHRSQGRVPDASATFADCELRLPDIKAMGFDVIYFVPIHPIGHTHRKGRNNALEAKKGEPGSPYAIGSEDGGHTAVHPHLGTLEDFDNFVEACHAYDMEVALDFAIQCSPDHPWIEEHPEWFVFRPDGTIKYAENPPKKYQDIVNVNFYGPHQAALWTELKSVLEFWIDHGVKIFRVDNPHTKPVPFWEWVIGEIRAKHPDVVFLAEAFTRPPMLKMLAKVGFQQSYTYFTWRHFKQEFIDYLTELTQTDVADYLRPNFFANTPDINPPFLQTGGAPAHKIRLVLAATLSSVYGIYNGFELCEATPVPGTEEYLDSEKYQYKLWDWDRPGNIKAYIARVNEIRRDNPALHELTNLRFYPADDDNVLFYGKMTDDGESRIFVAVNLDPFDAHEATIEFPIADMELEETDTYQVEELLTGARHLWRGAAQTISLDPETNPAMIFRVGSWQSVDYRSPCF